MRGVRSGFVIQEENLHVNERDGMEMEEWSQEKKWFQVKSSLILMLRTAGSVQKRKLLNINSTHGYLMHILGHK